MASHRRNVDIIGAVLSVVVATILIVWVIASIAKSARRDNNPHP